MAVNEWVKNKPMEEINLSVDQHLIGLNGNLAQVSLTLLILLLTTCNVALRLARFIHRHIIFIYNSLRLTMRGRRFQDSFLNLPQN